MNFTPCRAFLHRVSLLIVAGSLSSACAESAVPGVPELTTADAAATTDDTISGDDAAPSDSGAKPQDSGTLRQDGAVSTSDAGADANGGVPTSDAAPTPAGNYIQGTLMVGTTAVNLDPPASITNYSGFFSCGTTNYAGSYGVSLGWLGTPPTVGTYPAVNQSPGVLVMVFLPSGSFSTVTATIDFTTADATNLLYLGVISGLQVSFPNDHVNVTAFHLEFRCKG
jgi:hypothetical protein